MACLRLSRRKIDDEAKLFFASTDTSIRDVILYVVQRFGQWVPRAPRRCRVLPRFLSPDRAVAAGQPLAVPAVRAARAHRAFALS